MLMYMLSIKHLMYAILITLKQVVAKNIVWKNMKMLRDIKAALVSVTTTHRSCRIPLVVAEKKKMHMLKLLFYVDRGTRIEYKLCLQNK